MDEAKRASLSGRVSAVIFENEENGYAVLTLVSDDGEENTVVGCLPYTVVGERLELE